MSVRGSPLTMVFESARSFWLNVSRAASTTARKVWKPASVGLTSKVTVVEPAASSTGWVATSVPSANSRTVAVWATDERTSTTTGTDSPRRAVDGVVMPLDQDLVDVAETDPAGLDPDALRRGERGLGLAAAGGVVAVREQDDPLLGVIREQRRRETKRRADVGGRLDRGGGETVDLGQVGREALDQRLLAERDDAGHVAVGPFLQGVAQERERVLATRVADRIGQVDDEDGREPVDREHQLEPGQREDQGRQEQRPNDERDAPAPRTRSAAAPRDGARSSAAGPG